MFCINCKKIITIRSQQGQDYYEDLCQPCQKTLVGKICKSILDKIS